MRAHLFLLATLITTVACDVREPPLDEDIDAPDDEVDCSIKNEIELHLTQLDGVADVQTVPITLTGDDQDAWLALDTGSPLTFLFSDPSGPEFLEHAGTIALGCETWDVPGYREDAIGVEMLDGKPILGILGIDFFTEHASEIDYPGARVARYFDDTAIPEHYASAPTIALHGREHDRPLVDVVIDDTPLTMLFDAGAHDTIWLGVEGDDDDEIAGVQTADGAIWEVFIGDGVLAFPGEAERTVPVMRALDIGYIKPELDEIGAQGLLGLTSMGWRSMLFDFDEGVMRLGAL